MSSYVEVFDIIYTGIDPFTIIWPLNYAEMPK